MKKANFEMMNMVMLLLKMTIKTVEKRQIFIDLQLQERILSE